MRLVYLLPIALLIGCLPAAPEEASPDATEVPPLRQPDVRYEPTPQPVVHQMLELARVGAGDIVYDLGSGDGRIPITAARYYGARAVGIDIDPDRIADSNAKAIAAGVTDRVTFRNEDLVLADFRDATVVTLFLSPALNLKLRPRLRSELKPGTRVVSYYHDMSGWRPQKTVRTDEAKIYLWTIPERASPISLPRIENCVAIQGATTKNPRFPPGENYCRHPVGLVFR